jgi:hypothetical protein
MSNEEDFEEDYGILEGYQNNKDFAEVLLDEINNGYEIHHFGNFIPSYIFELVRNLTERPNSHTGFLDLWIQVPFRFNNRPDAIALLVEFIRKSAVNLDESIQFVEDCLALLEADSLSFSIGYFKNDPPKTPLSRGMVLNRENEDDLWAYTDNRATKPKNWVSTARSWVDNEFVDARRTLQSLIELSSGIDTRLDIFRGGESIGWLGYASDWAAESDYLELDNELATVDLTEFLSVEDIVSEIVADFEDIDESSVDIFDRTFFDLYQSVLNYLKELDEFADEEDYVYVDEVDAGIRQYIATSAQAFGEIDCEEDRERYRSAGEHHLPPISDPYRYDSMGEATCSCICGALIIRRYGCHEIAW